MLLKWTANTSMTVLVLRRARTVSECVCAGKANVTITILGQRKHYHVEHLPIKCIQTRIVLGERCLNLFCRNVSYAAMLTVNNPILMDLFGSKAKTVLMFIMHHIMQDGACSLNSSYTWNWFGYCKPYCRVNLPLQNIQLIFLRLKVFHMKWPKSHICFTWYSSAGTVMMSSLFNFIYQMSY